MKLRVEDVQGRFCLTNFHGMDLTTDKLRSLIKKRCNIIEAFADVRTADGYLIRVFCTAFTTRRENQIRRTCYAKASQIRAIRAKMIKIITREATTCDLKDLVTKFIPEMIGNQIEKACQGIYPLRDTLIRKVSTPSPRPRPDSDDDAPGFPWQLPARRFRPLGSSRPWTENLPFVAVAARPPARVAMMTTFGLHLAASRSPLQAAGSS